MKKYKLTPAWSPPPPAPPARSFDLLGGWVEIYERTEEGGRKTEETHPPPSSLRPPSFRYLGLLVGLAALERFICRRPGRVFVVRFVQREVCGHLMPVGSFAAEAAPADSPAPVRWFPVDELRKKARGK